MGRGEGSDPRVRVLWCVFSVCECAYNRAAQQTERGHSIYARLTKRRALPSRVQHMYTGSSVAICQPYVR